MCAVAGVLRRRWSVSQPLTSEVMVDDGADALVVVADQDGTFSAGGGGGELFDGGVSGADGAWEHNVKSGAGTEISLRPDGAAVLLDDAAADGEA
jgi:hypothetical protein